MLRALNEQVVDSSSARMTWYPSHSYSATGLRGGRAANGGRYIVGVSWV